MTGPSTVTIANQGVAQDGIRSEVTGNSANAVATISDTTVVNNDKTNPSIGVYVLISTFTTPTGNGVLNMSGTNNVTTANGTTVEVNNRGTGNATINISGKINATSSMTNADDKDGIEATTHHGGTATISMAQASGVVSAKGGNGILIDSLAGGGIITGNIGSGMTINLDNTIAGANSALNPNSGISVFTQSTGTIDLTSGATINTLGTRADGIRGSANRGAIKVTNSGAITTAGANSRGMELATTAGTNGPGGAITVDNSGAIVTNGANSTGILATSTDGVLDISNSGPITTSGREAHGIQATTAKAGISTVSTNGAVAANGQLAIGTYALGSTTDVTVGSGGSVSGGWQADLAGVGANGLPSAGIAIGSRGSGAMLTNYGKIGALSDRAVAELDRYSVGAAGPLTIVNNGTMTGYVQLGAGASTFRNLAPSSFDIRHYADTNGDGIRDTKRVAISDFGAGNDQFLNETSGVVRLSPVAGAAVTDATGYYVPTTGSDSRPLEASFYDFSKDGLLQGQLVNLETFDNAGIVDLRGSVVGNTLVITGNPTAGGAPATGLYVSNGGQLLLNSVLNAGIPLGGQTNSSSDMLIVDSTQLGAGGATAISVTNVGGSGALTPGNGIQLVEVRNKEASAEGAFALNGDYTTKDGQQAVVGGAYAYTLFQNGVGGDSADGNWYLRSQIVPTPPGPTPPEPPQPPQPRLQPGVPVYEVYPQHLLALNAVPSMQQRVGNRYWTEPAPAPETVFCKDASQNFRCPVSGEQAKYYAGAEGKALIEDQAIWGRIEGSHASIEPAVTTSGTDYDTNVWRLQAGLDGLLHEDEAGSKLIGGITVHFGQASSDVSSFFGDGDIDTNGYGFGGNLTWYDQNGFYVDGQAQLTWFDSDLTSKALNLATPTLVDGNGGFGYALSVETGKRIDLNDSWTLTPQAQLVYSNVQFSRFTDVFGADVSLDSGDSLTGRLGLSADHDQNWKDEDGKTRRSHLYGIANLYYQFLDATQVDVSGTSLETRPNRLWGGLGLGGSYNWNDDKYSVFGEVSANSSLENFGDSYALAGTAGFRVKW